MLVIYSLNIFPSYFHSNETCNAFPLKMHDVFTWSPRRKHPDLWIHPRECNFEIDESISFTHSLNLCLA